MNRLTNKKLANVLETDLFTTFTEEEEIEILNKSNEKKIYKKLSQLEDIEEELGIDLLTLFKALKDRIIQFQDGTYSNDFDIEYTTKWIICDYTKNRIIDLDGYGKTWALTKEELENE